MLQYYKLEEAAKVLGTTLEQAKKLLDEHKIRQYRDGRGKVRYVSSAVDELARALGRGSEPELQLGEAPAAPRKAPATQAQPEVFDFPLGAESSEEEVAMVDLGAPQAGEGKAGGPRSPAPKPGSDSDVRLVSDSSDLDLHVGPESDVKMVEDAVPGSTPSSARRKAGPGPDEPASGDSPVRIVPMEAASDSDVRMVSSGAEDSAVGLGRQVAKKPSDSDIRLEQAAAKAPRPDEGSDEALVTEEIDLDAEHRKSESSRPRSGKKVRPTTAADATSPFELSESDLSLPQAGAAPKPGPSDSSDFELTPAGESSSPIEPSSGELQPADSVISLEGSGSEELEFELSAESSSSPKPAPKAAEEDSDSEFELSLDADSSSDEQPALSSPSDDSDSEFELTLDDSGNLAAVGAQPQAAGEEQDIFESEFEVPALEEESGSEAVAIEDSDSSLDSSEFDLALGEEDMAGSDEESGSQVVALEDEAEVDDAAQTVARPRRAAADLEEGEVEELLEEPAAVEEAEEEAEEGRPARAAAPVVAAAAVPWGPLPGIALIPCVVILLLTTLMGYELVTDMWGYNRANKVPGYLTAGLARMILGADELPKE
jgi:excisionase family DNA binding protein